VTSTEETLGEYVKALVQLDRLDSSLLLSTLQVRTQHPAACCSSPRSLNLTWVPCSGALTRQGG
jgi:hypothetical protein